MITKQRKPLAIIAAVVMVLLLAFGTAVPAFAEESDMTAQSNEKFDVVEPEYNSNANNYVTLPNPPAKEGYTFKGWSINGSAKLYRAGEIIPNKDRDKIQIQPVYESIGSNLEKLKTEIVVIKCCVVLGLVLVVIGLILICIGHEGAAIISALGGLLILSIFIVVGFVVYTNYLLLLEFAL